MREFGRICLSNTPYLESVCPPPHAEMPRLDGLGEVGREGGMMLFMLRLKRSLHSPPFFVRDSRSTELLARGQKPTLVNGWGHPFFFLLISREYK